MKQEWVSIVAPITACVSSLCAVVSVWLAVSAWKGANQAKRPYITVAAPGFKPLPKSPPFRLQINMENIGVNPAINLVGKILIFGRDLKTDPIVQPFAVANEVPPRTPTPYYNDTVLLPQNYPPQYVVLALMYSDAITKDSYQTIMYMKWDGVLAGQTSPDFVHVNMEEKEQMGGYLKRYLPGFEL